MKESNEQGITSGNGYAILKYVHITLSCKVGRHLLSYAPCPMTEMHTNSEARLWLTVLSPSFHRGLS